MVEGGQDAAVEDDLRLGVVAGHDVAHRPKGRRHDVRGRVTGDAGQEKNNQKSQRTRTR